VTAATADDCIHLTVDIVKEIHKAVIDEFAACEACATRDCWRRR